MSKTSVLPLALTSLIFLPLSATAAPVATQQEADRLKAVFERYVGHPAPGEAGSVGVTPDGTGYRASFDYKQMMRPFEAAGMSIEAASQSVLLTPNDNGTWHIAGDAMPPLVIHLKDQTITMKSGAYKYDGTYDPKLGLFLDQTVAQDGGTLDQEAPALSQHRRAGHTLMTQKAAPAETARANVDIHYALTDVTAQVITHSPPPKSPDDPAQETPSPDITYKVPTSVLDLHVERLPTWPLLDLWAYFVAHPNHDAITASQEELRSLLKAALPLMAGMTESASAEGLAVQSPLGEFKATKVASAIDVADLSGAGRMAMTLAVDGLTVPAASLPPWSVGLLPTTLDIHPTLTGLHIDEGARAAVESFDLAHDGFTPEQRQTVGHIFWPANGKVTLAPSHIGTPLLDLRFEGEATVGEAPAGQVTVTATGLDKAIAALQDAAAADPVAAQVMAQLVAAKSLGKPNPDGSIVWVVNAAADTPISINGVPLK